MYRDLVYDPCTVYIPSPDAVPDPLDALFAFNREFSLLGITYPGYDMGQLAALQKRVMTLSESKGGWRILTLSQESPKGPVAQAKILVRLENNRTRLKLFVREDGGSRSKIRRKAVPDRCPCCPCNFKLSTYKNYNYERETCRYR